MPPKTTDNMLLTKIKIQHFIFDEHLDTYVPNQDTDDYVTYVPYDSGIVDRQTKGLRALGYTCKKQSYRKTKKLEAYRNGTLTVLTYGKAKGRERTVALPREKLGKYGTALNGKSDILYCN